MYPEADFRTPLRASFRSTPFRWRAGGGVVGVLGVAVGGCAGGGALPVLLEVLVVVVAVRCRKLISTLSWILGGLFALFECAARS